MILVLGVGGNVSQGIVKALAASSLRCHIIGSCVNARAAGLFWCDEAVVSPVASDPHFLDWLIDTCQRHSVAGILSGVEPVLDVLSQNRSIIEDRCNARLIVSPPEKLAIARDKLHTAEWLREHSLSFPESAAANDATAVARVVASCGFPLIVKPRSGKGSEGIRVIQDSRQLDAGIRDPTLIVQQYLGDPSDEYTAATFSDCNGVLRGSLVLRRKLQGGTTIQAEVADHPEIMSYVERLARELQPVGPSNMQVRIANGRPVCFEINLRYSGTTPIRAHLGFNDVEAGVRHFILGEDAMELPRVQRGLALRYWQEVYVDCDAVAACEQTGSLQNPQRAVDHSRTGDLSR